MRSSPEQIATLVSMVSRKDRGSFELLYRATADTALRFTARIVRITPVAEDIVADVYLRIWDECRFDAQRGSALGWILMLCRYRAYDYLRASRRECELDADEEDPLVQEELRVPDDSLERLLTSVRRKKLLEAMSALEPAQRQLLSLAFYREFTHQEISLHTKLPWVR